MSTEKELIRDIAGSSMKRQKGRNIITICAVFLMALLMTGVTSMGISFGGAWQSYVNTVPGPGADGAVAGNVKEYKKIAGRKDVEWASLLYKSSSEPVIGPTYTGAQVTMFAPENLYYKKNGVKLTSGHFPKQENDLIISNTLRKKLKMKAEGEKLKLQVALEDPNTDATTEKEIEFTVCGYFDSPLAPLAGSYEEIYGSQAFIEKDNPEMLKRDSNIYIRLKKNYSKEAIYDKLKQINKEAGGGGVTYKMPEPIAKNVVLCVVLILILIGFAAYLIVYNVFSISLRRDMNFWGKLKTLGTTDKQLKKVINYQLWRLFIPGACAGLILGNILGAGLSPILNRITNFAYAKNTHHVLISALVGLVFSAVTLLLSGNKSFKMIRHMSPIEAERYNGKRKNKVLTVVSFSLSILMFITAVTVTFSENIKKEAAMGFTTDFMIRNHSIIGMGNSSYRPISASLPDKIRNLDFVKSCDVFYNARSLPDYEIDNHEKHYQVLGRVKNTGKLKEDFKEIKKKSGDYGDQILYGDDRKMSILALSPKNMKREMKEKQIISGRIDPDQFATGKYILYQREYSYLNPLSLKDKKHWIQSGDTLKLSFYNNETDSYVDRNLTVMAVIDDSADAVYEASGYAQNSIIMPDTQFKSIYPDYANDITTIKIGVKDKSKYKEDNRKLMQLLQESGDSTVELSSIMQREQELSQEVTMVATLGGVLSIFFAFIGIANIINTFINEILSRRMDYTKLQAIGMTTGQLHLDIVRRNLKICLPGLLIGVTAAAFGSWYICKVGFTGISWPPFILAALITLLVTAAIVEIVTLYLIRVITRQSIVERLRIYEE